MACHQLIVNIQMYRNNYQTQAGFASSQSYQVKYPYTTTKGFAQRPPLYPIGPVPPQQATDFRHLQRGLSPSPYLGREGMKPPSYQNRYLQRAESLSNQINISYEEREKRLIQKNEREIEEEERRRQQIRISYQRQIQSLSAKLNRNLQKKQKLHNQIDALQKTQNQLNQKIIQMRPPERNMDNLQHVDRKQQEMIILKNRLMSQMRESETQLNKKYEEEQKYWEAQVSDKERILFQLEQNLREKKLELHMQKQKSLEKPDFLSIQQQIRASHFNLFIEEFEDLTRRLKSLTEHREKTNKQIQDAIELKRPQIHNDNLKREELKRQSVNLQIRVKELERVSIQMDAANQNLIKELERKQAMINRYESDIHDLKQKKQLFESEIHQMLENARCRDHSSLSKSLTEIINKLNQEIRGEQIKAGRLKNAYQKLYQLLCSATSKNIHQTFNQSIVN